MELGAVDRITADAIGEPGMRTFYLQARAGGQLVTVIVEKEQVELLARSVLELAHRGPGPDDVAGPEDARAGGARRPPVARRAGCRSATTTSRTGSCSRSTSTSPRSTTMTTTALAAARGRRSRSRCGPAASRCSRSPATATAVVGARPATLPVLRQPDRPGGPRVSGHERAPQASGLTCRRRWPPASSRCSARCPTPPTPRCWCAAIAGDDSCVAVYKPMRGETPLWDFPDGTLHRREVAAFELAARARLAARAADGAARRSVRPRLGPAVRQLRPRRSTSSRLEVEHARRVPARGAVRRRGEQRRPQGRPLPARRPTARSG